MTELVDTHIHLYDNSFNNDIAAVTERAAEAGVTAMILPAIDSSYYEQMSITAGELKGIAYETIGLHPTSVKQNWEKELEFVFENLPKKEFKAIGEIGVDTYWSKEFLQQQIIVFEEQLKLAASHNLPVIIHSRDATEIILNSLNKLKSLSLRGVFHAFSGSLETYRKITDYGNFMVGIGGVVTFKNSKLSDVVKKMDINHLVLETDAPWLTPSPHRGKRNEPSYLQLIAAGVASARECSYSHIAEITTRNAKTLFNIP